jgi:hypothetical protein
MRSALTRKRGLLLLAGICCGAIIYFYPFLSSSATWMRHSQLRYENRTEIRLPFRWIHREPPYPSFVRPEAAITSSELLDTVLNVRDNGPNYTLNDQARQRLFRNLGVADMTGVPDDRTYPFRKTGLICGQVSPLLPDMLLFFCFTPDFRYSLVFDGRKEYIQEASEIAKQIIR